MSESQSLAEVVATGDYRRSLEALRDRLAEQVEIIEGRDLAPLSKQLADVMRELANLPAVKGRSSLDDLAARRRDRGSASAS